MDGVLDVFSDALSELVVGLSLEVAVHELLVSVFVVSEDDVADSVVLEAQL